MPDPTPPLPITADDILDTVREPLLVLDAALRVWRANRSFYKTLHVAPEYTEGRLVYELGNHEWDIPLLRRLLEEVLPRNTAFDDFEVAHDVVSIGRKVMLLNARRVYREGNHTESILLAIEDITERRLSLPNMPSWQSRSIFPSATFFGGEFRRSAEGQAANMTFSVGTGRILGLQVAT